MGSETRKVATIISSASPGPTVESRRVNKFSYRLTNSSLRRSEVVCGRESIPIRCSYTCLMTLEVLHKTQPASVDSNTEGTKKFVRISERSNYGKLS